MLKNHLKQKIKDLYTFYKEPYIQACMLQDTKKISDIQKSMVAANKEKERILKCYLNNEDEGIAFSDQCKLFNPVSQDY